MNKDISKKDAIEYAGRRFAEVYKELVNEDDDGRPVGATTLIALRAEVAQLAGTLSQLMQVLSRHE